jgi:hypothetical protein
LKENVVFIPEVNVIERDFQPVIELSKQIAEFLEYVMSLSWTQRKFSYKTQLVEKAKIFTLRVDEINCQVIIQLNAYSNQGRERGLSSDEDESEHSRSGRVQESSKDKFSNIKYDNEFMMGAVGMVIFVIIALYIHFYYP